MVEVYFLEEERKRVLEVKDNYKFVPVSALSALKCDILFVFDKRALCGFISDIYYEESKILETTEIEYIIIEDLNLLKKIEEGFDDIIDIKVEESWVEDSKYKKLYRFFRIKNDKLYCVVKNFKNFYYRNDPDGAYTAITGVKVSKCYDFWNDSPGHWEKDVTAALRHSLIRYKNNKVKFSKNVRICTFDIETNADVDAINTPKQIISIAAHDSFTGEFKYWELKNIGTKEAPESSREEEKIMLEDFFKYVSNFDIFTGFNIMKFDVPFILNRANKLGCDMSLLTGIKHLIPTCKFRGKDAPQPWFVNIQGLNVIDLMTLADKVIGYLDTKLQDKKLDTLANAILGEGKTKEIDTPAVLWANKDYNTLKTYNTQDVNITHLVDEKLGLLEMLLATVEMVKGINIDSASWNSKIIEFFIMSNFSNVVYPSVYRDREANVKGAICFKTIPGIHDDVGVFDFSGMYPSIIRSLNISYETKDPNGDININGIRFTSSKVGIMVQVVDKFTAMRKYYKEQKKAHEKDKDYKMYQLKEFAVKKLLASMYGVNAYIGFRLFDNDIANSITAAGRSCLLFVKDICEREGYEVIFGDTDSAGIKKIKGNPDFEALGVKIREELFNWMRTFTSTEKVIKNHKMEMECETIFTRVIFTTAKKNYMGLAKVMKGKKLEVPTFYGKGNFLMRKDTPRGMKEELRKIVMAVLENPDKDKNIQIIKDKVRDIKASLPTWTKDDLIIYKEINRDFEDYAVVPLHVKAAIDSNKYLGTIFSRQDYRGGYVFVTSKSHPEVKALFMNDNTKLTEEFKIDYDKYFEKFIVQKILLTFGKKVCDEVFQKNKLLSEYF